MSNKTTNLSTKTVMVIDNGLFISFARKIAPAFKKVYYYTPWQSAFPKSSQLVIGDGFDDIERVKFPLAKADEVDLWIFLDLYQHDLQMYLEEHGARVWGARAGEEMELYRWEFKQYLKKIGLPVQPVEHIIGTDALKEFLKTRKNKFVKTSMVRGDFETFRHDNYELSEPRLTEIEHHLGVAKENYEFVVEDELPDSVEIGYDGFTIDGQFPKLAMMAYEVKDMGMIGTVKAYDQLATPIKEVNSKLVDTLKRYNYRGFLSTEIRYGHDKRPYLIDPCCRLGAPSNELLQELFDDWANVLWAGATGELITPKAVGKFGVIVIIHSEWAVGDWLALHYPKELDRWVKLRFHTRINGKDYIAPQTVGLPDIGGVVGIGDTLEKAVKVCEERCKQIKGYQVQCEIGSLDKAMEVIKQGEKLGVKF